MATSSSVRAFRLPTERAQQRVMEAEARGSWEPLAEGKSAQLVTIAEAKVRVLKDAESGRRLGESTLRKYRFQSDQLFFRRVPVTMSGHDVVARFGTCLHGLCERIGAGEIETSRAWDGQ